MTVSGGKVTYDDHPPTYTAKLGSEFDLIVMGSQILIAFYMFKRFRALYAERYNMN